MKKLKTEKIQGVNFYFQESRGDGVIVTLGGYMNQYGDFVGLFNTKTDAILNLKNAKITKVGNDTISVDNLKSIDIEKYYR